MKGGQVGSTDRTRSAQAEAAGLSAEVTHVRAASSVTGCSAESLTSFIYFSTKFLICLCLRDNGSDSLSGFAPCYSALLLLNSAFGFKLKIIFPQMCPWLCPKFLSSVCFTLLSIFNISNCFEVENRSAINPCPDSGCLSSINWSLPKYTVEGCPITTPYKKTGCHFIFLRFIGALGSAAW